MAGGGGGRGLRVVVSVGPPCELSPAHVLAVGASVGILSDVKWCIVSRVLDGVPPASPSSGVHVVVSASAPLLGRVVSAGAARRWCQSGLWR